MRFKLSSKYGQMEEFRDTPHSGIDLAMPEGTELRSLFDGVIEKVYDGQGRIGEGVLIRTDEGTQAIYGHMSDVNVNEGDIINAGDFIGLSGNTGNSTGAHLHFGMKENGDFIDPTNYAEQLSGLSGGDGIQWLTPMGWNIVDIFKENAKEGATELTKEVTLGILVGLRDLLLESIGAITLIGCGTLIILKIAGYDKGYNYAGVLFVINILIKFLLGGIA